MAVEARAWITGEYPNQKINFELPSGPKGDKGDPGPWVPTQLNGTPINTTPLPAGLYYQTDNAATIANGYPAESFIGEIISTRIGLTRALYRAYPVNWQIAGNYFYEAGFTDGVLGPWKLFTSTRIDNTVGKAIYQWDPTAGREQMIYGDTGLRSLPLATGSAGAFNIRRVGQQVEIRLVGFTSTVTKPNILTATLPNGMRPGNAISVVSVGSNGTDLCSALLTYDGSSLTIEGLSTGNVTFVIQYLTSNAWPTTLPGTPV